MSGVPDLLASLGYTPDDCPEALRAAADTLALPAQEKGLELICPARPLAERWYHGDPGRIRQILANLVGNAIFYTPEGESVNVKSWLDQPGQRGAEE